LFNISSKDKKYLTALLGATGVIIFWRGLWEGADLIPIVKEPIVSIFIGLAILTFTGVIYEEFYKVEMHVQRGSEALGKIWKRLKKQKDYKIHYLDSITSKVHSFKCSDVVDIENDYVIIKHKKKEFFIPMKRVHAVKHKSGKVVWKQK